MPAQNVCCAGLLLSYGANFAHIARMCVVLAYCCREQNLLALSACVLCIHTLKFEGECVCFEGEIENKRERAFTV